MKIAFLHFYTFRMPRGIETMVLSMANKMAMKGHEITVVTAYSFNKHKYVPLHPNVRVHEYPTFRYFEHMTIAPFFLWDLLHYSYDIVNVFFADFGEAFPIRIAKRFKPFLLNIFIAYSYGIAPHRFHSLAKKGLANRAHRIFAVSQPIAQEAQRLFHRPVETIWVAADPDRFVPNGEARIRLRPKFGYTQNDVILVSVAALEKQKGIQRVIEVLPELVREMPQLKFLVFGRGEAEAELKSMTKKLGLEKAVRFAGITDSMEELYNVGDIFILLADEEANSVATVEAMACEMPLIVSNTGGFPEMLEGHDVARLVDPGNREAVIQAIRELANDPHVRHELGKKSRALAISKYTWRMLSEKLLGIFEEDLRAQQMTTSKDILRAQ